MTDKTLEQIKEALQSVLCDPKGNVCIKGSDGDRQVVQQALTELNSYMEEKLPREAELLETIAELRKVITRNVEIWDRHGVIYKKSDTYLYNDDMLEKTKNY